MTTKTLYPATSTMLFCSHSLTFYSLSIYNQIFTWKTSVVYHANVLYDKKSFGHLRPRTYYMVLNRNTEIVQFPKPFDADIWYFLISCLSYLYQDQYLILAKTHIFPLTAGLSVRCSDTVP